MALVGVAGLASIASAQDYMKLDVQVSTDGAIWGDDVSVNPGDSVMVRFVVDWNKAGTVAWGGTTLTQLNIGNSAAGDTASNFGGKTQPSSQTFNLFNAGAANAKIDRLDNPGGSIQMAQLPLNNGGDAAKPIVVFNFKYNVAGDARVVVLDAPASNMTLATLFTTAGGSSASIASAGRSIDGARINVVPTPGALALAGAGALVARRRRR
jgi:hypothetical protein